VRVSRTTLVLGLTALAAVAAAAIVTVAGRGSGESPQHKAVARYIEDVDAVQQELKAPLTRTASAYRTFASTRSMTPDLRRDLAHAEVTLRRLKLRLLAVTTPEPATRLRLLLVRLVTAEVSTAHEVRRFAEFMPDFTEAVRASQRARETLAAALAAVATPEAHAIRGTKADIAKARAAFAAASANAAAEQADAIELYQRSLAVVERRLATLHPPTVMLPGLRGQRRMLHASREAAIALARELRKSDRSHVGALGRRFTLAARSAATVGAQQAQIAAIKAYNSRVRSIGTIQGRISDELARLQRQY
jgi:hypothetical protein